MYVDYQMLFREITEIPTRHYHYTKIVSKVFFIHIVFKWHEKYIFKMSFCFYELNVKII